MIKIKNVSYTYDKALKERIISGLNIEIPRGQVVLLCGRSGSGKTTFGRLINGLIPNYYEGSLGGSVKVLGNDIAQLQMYQLADKVGSVFQNPKSQFYTLLADTEIVFGCENIGLPKKTILRRFEKTVELFQLEKLLGKSLLELSGGEKQKIACASVSMLEPDIYVLDEPTSNLDVGAIHELQSIIEIWKKEKKTIVIAEHRLSWLWEIADRVIRFEGGSVVEDVTAELFFARTREEFNRKGLRYGAVFAPWKRRKSKGMPAYELDKFTYKYPDGMQLDVPRLEITKGSVVAILGDNGAGKSTFAKCLCGFMKHCRGEIRFEGKRYKGRGLSSLGYMVFQDVNHQLFSESVQDEIMLGADDQDHAVKEKANEVLRRLELDDYRERHPLSLSGGQKQRLAVADAIVSGKDLIIYDEPTSGLDYENMVRVSKMINEISETGKTQMLITHDPELVERCCDSFIFFENGTVTMAGDWTDENISRVRKYFRISKVKGTAEE